MKDLQKEAEVIEIADVETTESQMVEKEVELGYFNNYLFEGTGPSKHFQGSCTRIHYCSCDCHDCSFISSDRRLKKEITENVPGLDFVTKLRPVTYKYINHDNNSGVLQTGFIAQEVETVAKEIGYEFNGVSQPANENEFYSLQYSSFVAPLVKAIQELMNKNNELTLRIEKQNEEINKLQKAVNEYLLDPVSI